MQDLFIILFVIGCIFFGWPILSIFKLNLSKYLFLAWFIFIVLIFFCTRFKKNNKSEG